MSEKKEKQRQQWERFNRFQHNFRRIITGLSFVVIFAVFWSLKLTGIGIAGEAFCGMKEHTHSDECQVRTLICTLEEMEPHIHDESCFRQELICTLEEAEPHTHDESCLRRELICLLEETEEHTHEEACWSISSEFGCGLEEGDGHIHGQQCMAEETVPVCDLESTEGHTHSEACYEILQACPEEEHTHIESCYSDITADLETSDDWEMTLKDMVRGPTTRENVVLVAQSQLGYMESTLNFQVDENGIRRGITRYGQWYGNPYGDWSAMFASFCLSYAGADVPANAGPEAMRLEWEMADLYLPAEECFPGIGNLVFLCKDSETGAANAVAIVTAVGETTITVIEGDLDDMVAETEYEIADPMILGYGVIPSEESMMALASSQPVAQTITYSNRMFTDDSLFLVYTTVNSQSYAFDGNGNAVPITIDSSGRIYADVSDPGSLLWSFKSSGTDTYLIRNVSTELYMHNFSTNGGGVVTSGEYTSRLVKSGTGVKIRSNNNDYSMLNGDATAFQLVQNQTNGSVYYFGQTERCTIWLDGTDGGLGHLTGSPDTAYTSFAGATMVLPTQWTSPSKYSYKLRGWYDVTNARYYQPGEEMVVTGNAVLYADWVAATYDIGQFNAQVADSVSTNSFITTHMFDYNYLFNIHSSRAQATVSATDHSEKWSMVTSGNVAFGNAATKNFIFVDNDSEGLLCIPSNRSSQNVYPGAGVVTQKIYTAELGDLLFSTDNAYDPDTGTGILGKTYLGTGDYLFQFMDDPNDEHYGYYYYDSARNAASYHQSNGRFYVYEYLEATSDSIGDTYSDFLPLNSPYANTNGKTTGTYEYAGVDNEYEGIPHFRYDSKYNSGNYNGTNNVQTDYAYGMRSDIQFYLPNEPGTGGNKDMYGNSIQFQFSGDDDLWVLVDGILVLDIGGIHGAEDGTIDFSTGKVTVQGKDQTTLMNLGIGSGDHTMSILYLERGSSKSNCSIYFNLAPRLGLQIHKEDVLTQQILDGAEFTVYKDFECTDPAELWESEEAYKQDLADGKPDQSKGTFTVKNGTAKLWGLGSGNTYYIKETKAPDNQAYGLASGVIRLTIEREGQATYLVDVIDDAQGNAPSNGYTVHGVRIDEQTKTVYIVVTNAPETVTETTTVQVIKKWEDNVSHGDDYISAYLTVTDPDGITRRIREVTLSEENNWMYIWTNLPKYDYETLTEVKYGVEESYESGYYSTVRKITEIVINTTQWAEALSFQNGETYILSTSNGYLSTLDDKKDTGFKWVDEQTAKSSPNALWTVTVKDGKVKFTNGLNQVITLYYGGRNPTDFYARVEAPQSADRQEFSYGSRNSGLNIFYQQGNTKYYLANTLNSNKKFNYNTNANSSLVINPIRRITQNDIREVEDWAYQITNTPLDANNETSFAVKKEWSIPAGTDPSIYQEFSVNVQLLANGVTTGRSITLNLKNNWQGSFLGLPYKDDDGNVIVYSVEENWEQTGWGTVYGEIKTSGTNPPTYSTVITNVYYPGGPELPATGSAARMMYVLCGSGIILGTLVYGIESRRKRERRMK